MSDDPRALIHTRRTAIDARLADIEATIAPLEAEKATLATELRALRVAEEVFADLTGGPAPAPISRRPARPAGTDRPRGAPTVAEMLTTVLTEAVEASGVGLRPHEIVEEIRRRWWPGVVSNDVIPPLHRFVNRGMRFERDGERFRPARTQ